MSASRAAAIVGSATMKMREAKPVRNWPMTALVRRSQSIPGTGAPYHGKHHGRAPRSPLTLALFPTHDGSRPVAGDDR
jgi:hypothetical protein